LKFVEGHFVALLVLAEFFCIFLNGLVGKMDIRVSYVLYIELSARSPQVSIIIPVTSEDSIERSK
jgi:hypothetical protein